MKKSLFHSYEIFFEDEIEQNEQRNYDFSLNEIVEYSLADICMEDVQDESGEEEFFYGRRG